MPFKRKMDKFRYKDTFGISKPQLACSPTKEILNPLVIVCDSTTLFS